MRHPYKIFIAESSTVVQKISPLSGQIAIWATPFGKAMSFALWKKSWSARITEVWGWKIPASGKQTWPWTIPSLNRNMNCKLSMVISSRYTPLTPTNIASFYPWIIGCITPQLYQWSPHVSLVKPSSPVITNESSFINSITIIGQLKPYEWWPKPYFCW